MAVSILLKACFLLLVAAFGAYAQTCPGGIEGISANDVVCCPLSCGSCGGAGCKSRPGGASACCGGGIEATEMYCDETNEAPCIVGSRPARMCPGGIEGISANDVVCCPLSCGSCGGPGCSLRPGGSSSCCGGGIKATHGLCSATGEAPCNLVPSTAQPTCSNGLPGYEASDVCCPVSCGQCAGSGCSKRGDGCCTKGIKASGIKCSQSRSAPCNIDNGSVEPFGAAHGTIEHGWSRNWLGCRDRRGPNDPRIQQWTLANTITTASEKLEHPDYFPSEDNRRVGPGTAFGRAYVQNLPPQRNVLLVPTAYRGAGLVDGPWSPGGRYFEGAVTKMEAALEGEGNCVAAILWHQGERDAYEFVDQDTYESSWQDMISELRSRIPAAAEAPVILGELVEKQVEENPDNYEPILAAIRVIPASVSTRTAVASSEVLEHNPNNDYLHFDAAGQREFGQRYFDKLVEAIENE